jgi:hypothetical protein
MRAAYYSKRADEQDDLTDAGSFYLGHSAREQASPKSHRDLDCVDQLLIVIVNLLIGMNNITNNVQVLERLRLEGEGTSSAREVAVFHESKSGTLTLGIAAPGSSPRVVSFYKVLDQSVILWARSELVSYDKCHKEAINSLGSSQHPKSRSPRNDRDDEERRRAPGASERSLRSGRCRATRLHRQNGFARSLCVLGFVSRLLINFYTIYEPTMARVE